MNVEPYLFFDGRCEEAISFYQRALGAEVLFLSRNADNPEPPPPGTLPPGSEQKVMHATLRIGNAVLMVSDGGCGGSPAFQGFSLSLNCRDADAARASFAALADGGEMRLPLRRTFWSPLFGMVNDRFGVGWMVSVSGASAT